LTATDSSSLTSSEEIDPAAAAVLTDMNTARIFVFGLGQVISAEEVKARKFIE